MNTGDVIKYLRKRKNMTQKELADLLGVKKSSIQKYESGRVQNLKLETIQKLCNIFKTPPFAFIFPNAWKEIYLPHKITKNIDIRAMDYLKLTKEGKLKVLEYIKDISEIDRYCSAEHKNEELPWLFQDKSRKKRKEFL